MEDKIQRLVPLIEGYASEIGVDRIYAGSYTDLMMNEHFLYSVFIFINGLKQKIVFDGNFIKDNDFDFVLDQLKVQIKTRVEELKSV